MPDTIELIIISGANSPISLVEVSGINDPISLINSDSTLHNASADLQGGASGEFFHLNNQQYSFVTGISQDKIDPSNDVILEKNAAISGTILQGSGYSNYLSGLRVLADGKFSISGDAQVSEHILKKQTSDGQVHELEFSNSSKKLSLPDNSSWNFNLRVVAKDTQNNTATFSADGAIKKGISAGFTEIVGKCQIVNLTNEIGCSGILFSANTTYGYLKIDVVGKADTTIRWVGYLDLIEVR